MLILLLCLPTVSIVKFLNLYLVLHCFHATVCVFIDFIFYYRELTYKLSTFNL